MRIVQRALVAVLALGMGGAQAQEKKPGEKLKVGFVYVGPVADYGYSYQHDQSRKALAAALGDKVETSFLENVPEADSERSIEKLARSGAGLIFTTSFGFMEPTLKVARKFPKVKFEHATGYKQDKNMGTYLARTYEGRYVGGFIAAKMTKTKKIGYVASFPIPEVLRDIDAIQLALNKYNPGTEIKVVWVNSWFDPGKEADAANALIDQGVDVVFQHTDSPAPIQAAERRGVYAVGYASDMAHFGPKAVLTSIVNDWAPHYIQATQSVIDHTWKPQDYWGGLKEGTVELPISDLVPAPVKAEAEQIIADIKSGAFQPFTGSIKDQAGVEKIPAGVSATNAELASMNYYVEGMKAEMPK